MVLSNHDTKYTLKLFYKKQAAKIKKYIFYHVSEAKYFKKDKPQWEKTKVNTLSLNNNNNKKISVF